ncbi:MAG: adenylosuccinate lyase [Clostridia bacterium]|nr:adenylosuccinate lyase [Clostridia bacterium]
MINLYESPFSTRYSGEDMQYFFSQDFKFRTWRKLWIALAKAEKQLGLNITDEQIASMEKFKDDINYDVAKQCEKEMKHDVMAHLYAYGQQCPDAQPIIHLGATSSYVTDNTDIIIMKETLGIIRKKVVSVIKNLSAFAKVYKNMPCLSYTHLQPAQLTTVGKRATLWINELIHDFYELNYRLSNLSLLGSKGATGTQGNFLELFDNDSEKVKQLDEIITREMGFFRYVPVSGQTYSRKVDSAILSTLSGIAQSAYKFAGDLRILQSFKEMEEPYEKSQVSSTDMPYKVNPTRSERICALARYVMCDSLNPVFTSATQLFERTVDDSANRRISVPEAFLATDAILNLYMNITSGLVVYPKVINSRVMCELPFMVGESIMLKAVKNGAGSEIREKLREYCIAATTRMKKEGLENDLIDRICGDKDFNITKDEAEKLMKPELYTGRSTEQVDEFLCEYVNPLLELYESGKEVDITV